MKPDSPEPRPTPPPPADPGLLPKVAALEEEVRAAKDQSDGHPREPADQIGAAPPRDVRDANSKRPRLRGFWFEVGRRYRKNFFGVAALVYVAVLSIVAILSPAIVGTKPVIVRYKGAISLPSLGYFYEPWEDR